jgi:protein-disulfide isomerase
VTRAGYAIAALALFTVFSGGAGAAGRSEVVEGNPSSPVRLVIYEDLQCADCEHLRAILDSKILPRYGKRVAIVHRDFPLGKHDWARPAAVAARWVYAQDPDLGIVFRRELLAEHDHISAASLKGWIEDFATRNRLDRAGIVAALTDPQWNAMVDQDYQGAVARGISHTPTVIAGGQKMVDTILYEDVARALDSELSR